MHPIIADILKSLLSWGEFVFAIPRAGTRCADFFQTWDRARIRTGLSDMVFHDLKRMSTSGELQNGTYLNEFKFPSGAIRYIKEIEESVYICGDDFYNYISAVFCPILTPSIIIRARRLHQEKPVFREDFRCGEDIDLWFRLVFSSNVIYIDEPLCAYRYHETSTTQDKEDFFIGTIKAHRINLDRGWDRFNDVEKQRYIRRISERYQHLAYWYYERYQMQRARWSYLNAFRINHDHKIIVRYFKTFLPKIILDHRRKQKA